MCILMILRTEFTEQSELQQKKNDWRANALKIFFQGVFSVVNVFFLNKICHNFDIPVVVEVYFLRIFMLSHFVYFVFEIFRKKSPKIEDLAYIFNYTNLFMCCIIFCVYIVSCFKVGIFKI